MRKHHELILKIACCALAGLVLFQLARLVLRSNPLRGVRIPELPSLSAGLDATNAAKAGVVAAGKVAGTNATNTVTSKTSEAKVTNAITAPVTAKLETSSHGPVETNSAPAQVVTKPETNSSSGKPSENAGTNTASKSAVEKSGTNAAAAKPSGKAGRQSPKDQPGAAKLPELAPIIQSRIDKIVQSEMLAPRPRKMPMALLGIAGQDAFIRTPSGQTGLVKEGGELGGIKLLQIGVNRVLVEQEGEKKELTMFSGLGSESLLSKPKAVTNETIIKSK